MHVYQPDEGWASLGVESMRRKSIIEQFMAFRTQVINPILRMSEFESSYFKMKAN